MTTFQSLGPYRTPVRTRRLVPPPTRARGIAYALAGAFAVFIAIALLSPWQQNVGGTGRVIAYAPVERSQSVDAPVSGVVAEWFVQEGTTVAQGDPLVRLADNDPRMMERLELEAAALRAQLVSYEERVEAQRARIDAVQRSETSGIAAYEARVRGAREAVRGADQAEQAAIAAEETARLNLERQRSLHSQGLSSTRDLELSQLASARAQTGLDSARARARGARQDLAAAEASLEQSRGGRDVSIESARAALNSAESDVSSTRGSLARLENRISRQEAQVVLAPRAGTIFRLIANQGGEQVSAGDPLAILVPDTDDRAVEIWVDGNDAALISPGNQVRLQFEGWPAVQFTGWPSVAVGTFGGRVAFVDSTDDGNGDFRVVVTPDEDDEAWPSTRFLRQGVRANGWVLLERVSVGFELWRQLNGFPPKLGTPPGAEGRRDAPGAG